MNRYISDKWLFFRCLLVLTSIQIALKFLKFDKFRKIAARMFRSRPRSVPAGYPGRVHQFVEQAAFHTAFPATCLHKSLAVKYLLRGDESIRLQVGVQLQSPEELKAHAWIEQHQKVLGEGQVEKQYRSLWVWE